MARTYDGVTIERDALKEVLTALNIGYEALIEYEGLAESSETVLAEGWDDVDRQMHEHEKKIVRKMINEVADALDEEG